MSPAAHDAWISRWNPLCMPMIASDTLETLLILTHIDPFCGHSKRVSWRAKRRSTASTKDGKESPASEVVDVCVKARDGKDGTGRRSYVPCVEEEM